MDFQTRRTDPPQTLVMDGPTYLGLLEDIVKIRIHEDSLADTGVYVFGLRVVVVPAVVPALTVVGAPDSEAVRGC